MSSKPSGYGQLDPEDATTRDPMTWIDKIQLCALWAFDFAVIGLSVYGVCALIGRAMS